MATTPAPRKSASASKAPAAAASTSRTKADKLESCFALALRLSAALKRAGESDLSRQMFRLATEIDAKVQGETTTK